MLNKYRFLVGTFILFMTACSHNESANDSQLALIKTTNPPPAVTNQNKSTDKVADIKKEVSSIPAIYDVAVVKGKKDTLVVYKVKHLHRFKMKKIEKDVTRKLEEQYPKEDFTVSSDYKIFLEAVRLNERMKKEHYPSDKAEKRLNEIVKMTEDLK